MRDCFEREGFGARLEVLSFLLTGTGRLAPAASMRAIRLSILSMRLMRASL